MKSLMSLISCVLQDCETLSGTTTTRDFKTISRRVEKEGLSFLTITLGDFAQDFERGLERGYLVPTDFRAFAKKSGSIPKLFSGMIELIFDVDGRLLSQPSINCILCIRQICRMFKKIHLPCSESRSSAAFDGYAKLEKDGMLKPETIPSELYELFGKVSDFLWSQVLGSLSEKIESHSLIPRHGPGKVAERLLPNQKYVWKQTHERLSSCFPPDQYLWSNPLVLLERQEEVTFLTPEHEIPVRVVSVPKTLKAPRIIGIEPTCMQYAQQALAYPIMDLIESNPLTRGKINFRDQSINAKLALLSSKDGILATLDLSEASDRVHKDLIWRMLKSIPSLRAAIFACRSMTSTLPNGTTIPLKKFASMGSSLCFPMESMLFYTIMLAEGLHSRGLSLSRKNLAIVQDSCFVYGDDLICPSRQVPTITHWLEAFGLKVNTHKSFWIGKFRESCGMDAYDGMDVTPFYLRQMLPSDRRQVSRIVSLVAFSNQAFLKGFFRTATYIESLMSRIGISIPYSSGTASYVAFYRPCQPVTKHRYNDQLFRSEVRSWVVVAKKDRDQIDGYDALMKWFIGSSKESSIDHYLRSVGSGRLTLKRQWCPAI